MAMVQDSNDSYFHNDELQRWCETNAHLSVTLLVIDLDLFSHFRIRHPGADAETVRQFIIEWLGAKRDEQAMLVALMDDRFVLGSCTASIEVLSEYAQILKQVVSEVFAHYAPAPTFTALVFSCPKHWSEPQTIVSFINDRMTTNKMLGRNTVRNAEEIANHVRSTNILLVDDEQSVLDVYKLYLRRENFQIVTAQNGQEAMDILRKQAFDLVVMDVTMPKISGLEALRWIKGQSTLRNVPVVMVTALTDKDTLVQAFQGGVDEFINKPVGKAEFQMRVRSILTQKRQRDKLLQHSTIFKELVASNIEQGGAASLSDQLADMCHFIARVVGLARVGIFVTKGESFDLLAQHCLTESDHSWLNAVFRPYYFAGHSQKPFFISALDSEKKAVFGVNETVVAIPIPSLGGLISSLLIGFGGSVEIDNDILNILSLFASRVSQSLFLKDTNKILENLVQEKTKELQKAVEETTRVAEDTIYRLSIAAEYRDNETGNHVKRISYYAEALARHLGYTPELVKRIKLASPMHDIGKIAIPDKILLKPGKLDQEEFAIMKTHTLIGGKILGGSRSTLLETAKVIALTHHEKWDGSGYPRGLKSENIPEEGRIVAVCDVFDALMSKRTYKEAFPLPEVIEILQDGRGKHFDPAILDLFMRIIHTEIVPIFERYSG